MNKTTYSLALLLIATLVVRMTTLWIGYNSLADDPDAYSRLAVTWSDSSMLGIETPSGNVRPTAYRPPLYPWILSWLVNDDRLPQTSIAILHLALGLSTVYLTFSIARVLGLALPWLPALAVALDPLLLRASQLVMTETIAAFFVVLIWRLWLTIRRPGQSVPDCGTTPSILACDVQKKNPLSGKQLTEPSIALIRRWPLIAFFGVALGLAILVRPTFAPWAVVCAVCLVLIGGGCWRRRVADGLIASLAVLVCVVPWTLRNYSQLGKPIWATTHGGYTLLLANNPRLYEHFGVHGPSRGWDAEPFHLAWAARVVEEPNPTEREFWFVDREPTSFPPPQNQESVGSDELQDDVLAYSSAWATIERSPSMFVVSCVYRAGWFWALWPYAPSLSLTAIAIGSWYFVWYAAAIRAVAMGWNRLSVSTWIPVIALVVILTTIHAIYWGNMRMRAPLMSILYLLAATRLLTSPRFVGRSL